MYPTLTHSGFPSISHRFPQARFRAVAELRLVRSYMRGPVMTFNVRVHDSYPPQETALVDHGLGEANDAATPLHEVRPLSCFACTKAGRVVGGAVSRWWGQCCELQQLWVEVSYRHRGIGTHSPDRACGPGCQKAPPAQAPDTQLSAPALHLPTQKATCGVERPATAC